MDKIMDMPRNFVTVDTCVILDNHEFYKGRKEKNFYVTFEVLQELDKNKGKSGSTAYHSRRFFRFVRKNLKVEDGTCYARIPRTQKRVFFEKFTDAYENNDGIISTKALSGEKLITRDISMFIQHKIRGGEAELLIPEEVKLTSPKTQVSVPKELIDSLNDNGRFEPDFKMNHDFYILQNELNESHSALAWRDGHKLRSVKAMNSNRNIKFVPRSAEQRFAYEVLTNPKVDLVALYGKAGVSKTFLSLVAGLEMCQQRKYDEVLITRPVQSVGEDMGFLPGTSEEKWKPWLSPFYDNLKVIQVLSGVDYEQLLEKVDFISIPHIRGRSFKNSFIIVDELQNASSELVKTIISRCGEGCKVVCTGDLGQIDNPKLSKNHNGLLHLLKSMKKNKFGKYLHLTKCERGKLSEFAADNL